MRHLDYKFTMFTVLRGGTTHQVGGFPDPGRQLISFLSEADVEPDDLLTSNATQVQVGIVSVDWQEIVSGQISGTVATYETLQQRAQRLTIERYRNAPMIIINGQIENSIVNILSTLTDVEQSVKAS